MSSGLGGCEPAKNPRGGGTVETIRSFLMEARELTSEDYRAEVVPMLVAIGPGGSGGSFSFRAPTTHNFFIKAIRGVCNLIDPLNEPLSLVLSTDATKGIGSPTPTERRQIKAMNARIALANNDRSQQVFDAANLPLIAVVPDVGGQVIDFGEAQHILAAGETLNMTVSLVKATSSVDDQKLVGANTEYGLMLEGWLVRVKRS